jgi:hypothetical protein
MLRTTTLCLCLALPLAAQARPASPGIQDELHQDLADARRDVRTDLAEAREELQTGNLRLDNSLRFARNHGEPVSTDLPRAEITPQGDLLIEGEAQQIDAAQREQLLAYRGQIVAIALVGIDIGQKSADAALDAVDGSWVGLLFSAMTGRLERRIERIVNEQVQPAVVAICRQLPAVMDSQQQLASSVPAFRPYANLEADDVEDCESEVRHEFASR